MNLLNYKTLTFVDTETTHLDVRPGEIISICIVTEHKDGKIEKWETKIKPQNLQFASKKALEIAGYNEKEWEGAPSFQEVSETILEKLKWGPVIGHNVDFDIRHIKGCFRKYCKNKYPRFGYPLIDTVALAWLFLPTDKQNLNECRKYLNIDTNRAHKADTDVEDCRILFWSIVDKYYK